MTRNKHLKTHLPCLDLVDAVTAVRVRQDLVELIFEFT